MKLYRFFTRPSHQANSALKYFVEYALKRPNVTNEGQCKLKTFPSRSKSLCIHQRFLGKREMKLFVQYCSGKSAIMVSHKPYKFLTLSSNITLILNVYTQLRFNLLTPSSRVTFFVRSSGNRRLRCVPSAMCKWRNVSINAGSC